VDTAEHPKQKKPYNDISALPVTDEKLEDERLQDPGFQYI
jgi:hypothetical protein